MHRQEYGLPKIWVKRVHVYMADTRLSSSSPPRASLESLGMRLSHTLEWNAILLQTKKINFF